MLLDGTEMDIFMFLQIQEVIIKLRALVYQELTANLSMFMAVILHIRRRQLPQKTEAFRYLHQERLTLITLSTNLRH